MTNQATDDSWMLETNLPISFAIRNSPGLFDVNNPSLLEYGTRGAGSRRLVVIDQNICPHYLEDITNYFNGNNTEVHVVAIEATEESKNLSTLLLVLNEMERFGLLRRSEPVIAIGGGVLLDVVGMAAGLYRRGVPYIRVPTTLVGIIDASVGAKTGINFEGRRNRLGSYYPPLAAYLDKVFLKTLAPIEISSGMGEILKMGVIKCGPLFYLLEQHGQDLLETKFGKDGVADDVINFAVIGMKEELENNLWEMNLMRIVDFGHSFSPIIEMRSIEENQYAPLTHGQAVALDVIFSSIISYKRDLLSYESLVRVIKTASLLGLPTDHELFREPLVLLEALNDTKKHRNGAQNLPVPIAIGSSAFINDLTYDEIKHAARELAIINNNLFAKD